MTNWHFNPTELIVSPFLMLKLNQVRVKIVAINLQFFHDTLASS